MTEYAAAGSGDVPAIEVSDLRFSYGKREAVRGVSFAVAPGEILGFLGPNGAGKSTTLRMLTGQLTPAAGEVRILGERMTRRAAGLRARIGVSFEEKNLYPTMSARENLTFFARLFGVRDLDVDALIARVGLAGRGDDRVHRLSKGMQQRLMIARALVNRPEVLLLDEPTAGLDPVSSDSVRALVREEAARGAAVLLTTHDMAEADALADRVAFLDEGRIYALDTPENLKLQHGKRTVRVRRREGDTVHEEIVALDSEDTGAQLAAAVDREGLLTVHTEEASLAEIFLHMTGRGLGE